MAEKYTLLLMYNRFSETGGGRPGRVADDEGDQVEKNSRKLDELEQKIEKTRERRRTRELLVQTELEVLKERTRRLEIENAQMTNGPKEAERLEHDESTYREALLKAEVETLRERSRQIPYSADARVAKEKNKILDEIHNVEVDLYREKVKQLDEIHRNRSKTGAPVVATPQQVAPTSQPRPQEVSSFTSATYTTYEPGQIPTTIRQPDPIIVRSFAPQQPVQQVAPQPQPYQQPQPAPQVAPQVQRPVDAPVTPEAPRSQQVEPVKAVMTADDMVLGGMVSAEARAAITNISNTIESDLSKIKEELGTSKGSSTTAGSIANPFAKSSGKAAKGANATPDLVEVSVLDAPRSKQNKLFQTSSFFISPDSSLGASQKEEWARFKLRSLKKELVYLRKWQEKATDSTKDVVANATRIRIPSLTIKRFEDENKRNLAALSTSIDKLDKDYEQANTLASKKDNASTRKLIELLPTLYSDLFEVKTKRATVQDTAEELLVTDKALYSSNIGKRLAETQEKNKDIINLVLYYIKQVAPVLDEARITDEERQMIAEGSPVPHELEDKASQLTELTFTWNNIKRKFNLAQTALKSAAEDYEQKRYLKARIGLSRYDILTEEFRDEYQWNALSNNLEALGVKKITKVHQKRAVWLAITITIALLVLGAIAVGVLHLEDIVLPG